MARFRLTGFKPAKKKTYVVRLDANTATPASTQPRSDARSRLAPPVGRGDGSSPRGSPYDRGMTPPIRVGTCSWADETLTKVWYPKSVRSGEARLRHYAERFDVVEANSTYYRLPDAELVANWAERTPSGFTMHVKAFGLMTRHPVKLESLPEDLRDAMPRRRARPRRPAAARAARGGLPPLPPGARAAARARQARRDPAAVSVLRRLQAGRRSSTSSGRAEQLTADELLVEFRHRSWLDEENRERRSRSSSRSARRT